MNCNMRVCNKIHAQSLTRIFYAVADRLQAVGTHISANLKFYEHLFMPLTNWNWIELNEVRIRLQRPIRRRFFATWTELGLAVRGQFLSLFQAAK